MGNPDLPTPKHIVTKVVEAIRNPKNHRYSVSKGIYKLRLAIADWYRRRYDVELDPDSEAVVTIGAKEGLGHLVLATIGPGDVVMVPSPTYPIHAYSVVIAGGDLRSVPILGKGNFFDRLLTATRQTWPQPRMIIVSFPHNPTTRVVDLDFFEDLVAFAREHRMMIVHDFAYGDLVFDGYQAPSLLQVKGAKDVGVELFSMSKSYSMAGWLVGFAVGNPVMLTALARLKSYFDYGMFQPIQIASIIALKRGPRVRLGDVGDLPQAEGCPGQRAQAGRVGDRKAQGDHVRLGRDPGGLPEDGVHRVCEAPDRGREGRRLARHRFRGVRGGPRPVCPRRERGADQAGGAGDREGSQKTGFEEMGAMKEIKVGLIGLGTVGTGVVRILQKNAGGDRETDGRKACPSKGCRHRPRQGRRGLASSRGCSPGTRPS